MTISFRPTVPPKLPKIGIRIETMGRAQAADVAAHERCEILDPQGYAVAHAEWLRLVKTPGIRCLVAKHKSSDMQSGLTVGGMAFTQPADEPIFVVQRLVVARDFRRLGIGRALVMELIGHLGLKYHRNAVEVVIPETAMGAVLFFQGIGFLGLGVKRDCYQSSGESVDGWIMRYEDGDHAT